MSNYIRSISRHLFSSKVLSRNKDLRRWYRIRPNLQLKESSGCRVVDLRSETVTKPSAGMLDAMMSAQVGDDVLQEDPTVLELEHRMAEIMGKEAGLFVASGTMGNFLCVLAHCSRRGSEILLGNLSHIFNSEQANVSQFGSVQPFIVPTNEDGTFDIELLKSRIRSDDFHEPSTELICIENTHGHLGGKVLPLQWIDEVGSFAIEAGIPLHLDGARIFNASIKSGELPSRLLNGFSSASICLSKGLGTPVGTVIVGQKTFIARARRLRKALGGGWRQAGFLAAAGLYALDHNIERLADDHYHASVFAKGINDIKSPNAYVKSDNVDTNIIIFNLNREKILPENFCSRMMEVPEEEQKHIGEKILVKAFPWSPSSIRFVVHLDVSREDIDAAVSKIQFIIKEIEQKK